MAFIYKEGLNVLDEVTSNPQYARSKYPTQLATASFDEILDLTADVFLITCISYTYVRA